MNEGTRTVPPALDFADLLEQARRGDNGAMARLVTLYEPEIRRVARRRLSPALRVGLDSMDLVQSVHRSMLQGLRRNKFAFDGPRGLVRLAVTMVIRKAARHWERRQRERDVLELLRRLRPLARLGRAAEVADQLKALLDRLADRDRRLLTLYLDGHSTVEAADILGLAAAVLRVRRSRLFRKLRALGLDPD